MNRRIARWAVVLIAFCYIAFAQTIQANTATEDTPNYFTFTNVDATQDAVIAMKKGNNSSPTVNLQVRVLDSEGVVISDWTLKTVSTTSEVSFGTIPVGGKMQMYGQNYYFSNGSLYTYFECTGGNIAASGDIQSLIACSNGTQINDNYTPASLCFYCLFYACKTLVDAEDLLFPAPTISSYSYARMFAHCSNLRKAPIALPATTIAEGCYNRMFWNCTTMVSVPRVLPATPLYTSCYASMFEGCSSITTAPEIYGNTYAANSTGHYTSMYNGCTALNTIRTYQTTWGQSNQWVNGVATEGAIYCPPTLAREYGSSSEKMPYDSEHPWTVYSYNLTFTLTNGQWADGTDADQQFTWQTDTTDVLSFLEANATAQFFTDATCETPISASAIQRLLSTQREADAETTRTLYAVRQTRETVLLYDTEEYKDTYATTLSTYAGRAVDVILQGRTFPGGQWNTISLPFSLETLSGTPLDGVVYSITDATVDNLNGIQIRFNAVDNIIAGKPYLVWIKESVTNMRFDNVVMTTFTAGEFTTPSGYVKFIANIPWQKLTETTQIFINNNRLYYPNLTTGTKMRSFRGYFQLLDANGMIYTLPQRVNITPLQPSGDIIDITL